MRALSSSALLNLWERGSALHPLDRGLLALHTVFSEVPPADLADWTLGRRNHALLEMHCSLFGPTLQGWTSCAQCGEKMEFEINALELAKQNLSEDSRPQAVSVTGHTFRLPTTRDLAAVAHTPDAIAGAVRLLELCRTSDDAPSHWSEEEIEKIGEELAEADPLAEMQIALCCPTCANEYSEAIEIVSFLWAEIEACAKRLLWEVHALATAYGWTEPDVLALSPARRSLYIEMVQA
jgi:hypothetical protein